MTTKEAIDTIEYMQEHFPFNERCALAIEMAKKSLENEMQGQLL